VSIHPKTARILCAVWRRYSDGERTTYLLRTFDKVVKVGSAQ